MDTITKQDVVQAIGSVQEIEKEICVRLDADDVTIHNKDDKVVVRVEYEK